MSLIERVSNRVYKSNLSSSVEYHAGAFFVKKQVAYLIFTSKNTAYFYQREEGLHPDENNYEVLIQKLISEQKGFIYELYQPNVNSNLLKLTNKEKELRCMPSIFIENIYPIENVTEIILDNISGETYIFNLVFNVKN